MKSSFGRIKYLLGLGIGAVVVFSGLFATFNAQQTQAAEDAIGSATWVNPTTITYLNDTYKGPKNIDGDFYYINEKPSDVCDSKHWRIAFADDPTKAGTQKSTAYLDSVTYDCKYYSNQKLTVTNTAAALPTDETIAIAARCGSGSSSSLNAYQSCVDGVKAECASSPNSTATAQQECWRRIITSTCGSGSSTAAEKCNKDALENAAPGVAAPGDGNAGDDSTEEDPELDCNVNWSPLTWIACPIVSMINATLKGLDNAITGLLTIEAEKIFDTSQNPGKGYYASWQVFRSIALGLLVVGALIMIISQALGFDFLDAYTIKKVVPRLLIAIIGISLSWEIMRWFIVLTNNLGLGIRSLIYYPFVKGGLGDLGGSALAGGAIVPLLAVGGFFGLGLMGLLSFGATALMALIIAFLVLILRQLVIVVLILFAPLAIAAYILPNTQAIWKLWYESFTKALMMFPIIMAFLAVGRVFAMTSGGPTASPIGQIIGFIAYILPYFLIPLTFRFAGGALRTLGGFVNDRSRGGFDRLKKYRQGQYQSHGGVRMQRGSDRMLQARYKAYNNLKNKEGGRVKKFAARAGMGAMGGFNMEEQISAYNERNQKRISAQTGNGPDSLVRAYTVNKKYADDLRKKAADLQARAQAPDATSADREAATEASSLAAQYIKEEGGVTQYRTLGGSWQNEADVIRSQAAFGKNNHAAFQSALTYEMGKANTQDEQDHLVKSYGAATERFGMDATQASEVWIGSAYAKQNENRQWKHHKWEKDPQGRITHSVGGLGMMREIDEKQGSYQMMQQNADTWTTMSQEVITAKQILDGKLPERKEGQSLEAYNKMVEKKRAEAPELLQRAARIAYATRSASYSPTGSRLNADAG